MASLLEELWDGTTLVLSHRNADIDAMGSSVAIAAMFPNVTIGAVESVSRGAGNLLDNYGDRFHVLVDPSVGDDLSPYDRIVFVDTATPSQVAPYDRFLSSSIVIDHHARNSALTEVNPRYHCEPDSPSCAQIVHRLAVEAGAEMNPDAARALVAGILADTERFRIAPNLAVSDALSILHEGGLELADVIQSIEKPVYDRPGADPGRGLRGLRRPTPGVHGRRRGHCHLRGGGHHLADGKGGPPGRGVGVPPGGDVPGAGQTNRWGRRGTRRRRRLQGPAASGPGGGSDAPAGQEGPAGPRQGR